MKSRILLVAGVVAIGLGGCAAYPYDNYAQRDGYYPDGNPRYYPDANQPYREGPVYEPGYYGPQYVGPGYYVAPSVGFGITYSNRNYYGRHRHW